MNEVWATVAVWAASHGAKKINELPGLWEGETPEWKVAINGHKHEIEGVPPFSMRFEHKKYLLVGIVNAAGGTFAGGLLDEVELINHFKKEAAE